MTRDGLFDLVMVDIWRADVFCFLVMCYVVCFPRVSIVVQVCFCRRVCHWPAMIRFLVTVGKVGVFILFSHFVPLSMCLVGSVRSRALFPFKHFPLYKIHTHI